MHEYPYTGVGTRSEDAPRWWWRSPSALGRKPREPYAPIPAARGASRRVGLVPQLCPSATGLRLALVILEIFTACGIARECHGLQSIGFEVSNCDAKPSSLHGLLHRPLNLVEPWFPYP